MSLRNALNSLDQQEKNILTYALEAEITKMIKLPDGFFIGVNITPTPTIRILEQVGKWSYGEYDDTNN